MRPVAYSSVNFDLWRFTWFETALARYGGLKAKRAVLLASQMISIVFSIHCISTGCKLQLAPAHRHLVEMMTALKGIMQERLLTTPREQRDQKRYISDVMAREKKTNMSRDKLELRYREALKDKEIEVSKEWRILIIDSFCPLATFPHTNPLNISILPSNCILQYKRPQTWQFYLFFPALSISSIHKVPSITLKNRQVTWPTLQNASLL